ncbi:MAG TPA: GDSL-type esterase/lipase family protein, partial [Planctomycetota bacterium]|nr:GDSL-type esterase/lipase family protein [Planctomycetota bacterium]
MSGFSVQSGETFVLIGDSITDCGRRDPAVGPLGNGYVAYFTDLVTARHPERRIRFVNRGISGDTVLDLEARWEADVLAERPDWLSVMIGINDLHRTLDGVRYVPPEVYREYLEAGLRARYDAMIASPEAVARRAARAIGPFAPTGDGDGEREP